MNQKRWQDPKIKYKIREEDVLILQGIQKIV